LFLKDDAAEYVEQDKIKNLAKKYSEFINYPIRLYMSKDVREQVEVDADGKEVEKDENAEAEAEINDLLNDGTEVSDEEEQEASDKPEKKTKTVTKQVWEWETINDIKAIWMREKADITQEEYDGFYKTITKDTNDPLAHSHFSAEGEIEFKAILYVPGEAPYDLFENYYGKSSALKLYVRRVLITEEFDELMPRYLNFIKGVVDSDDLPLNVSRE
jgi:heat shock protein beta